MPVTVQGSFYSTFSGDELSGKYTGKNGSYYTSDAMYSESIQCVIIFESGFDDCYHVETDKRGN